MTPPPTIDGTDITGATIDGTDVKQITVDGDVVFRVIPDSVVSQYDATKESSTGSITSITDQLGFANLTGDASVEASAIDGKQAFKFQSESMTHNTTITTSDPFAVVAIIKPNQVNANRGIFDGGSFDEFTLFDNNGDRWAASRNNDFAQYNINKNTDTRLVTMEAFDSNKLELSFDGSSLGTKTLSPSDLTGLKLGVGGGSTLLHPDVLIGQLEVLEGHTPSDLQSVEDSLKLKWNTP
jgi:hypothetical protein